MENIRHTFSKAEKLCGKTSIERLLAKGKFGSAGCLRFRWMINADAENSRLLVSVPKKMFKRAVKRNLFKRRIRESWRKQKHLIEGGKIDILISYVTKECIEYSQIEEAVGQIIAKINKSLSAPSVLKQDDNNGN